MKLYDQSQKTGHLISFISSENKNDNFSIFFPITGLEQFDLLLKINKGLEESFNKFEEKEHYPVTGYSVNDIDHIRDIFSEIDENRLLRFELTQFLDEELNFVNSFANIVIKQLIGRNRPIYPDIRTGSMATGPNFFNRSHEINYLWQKVKTTNLLLQAPRRYGKSSFLNYIAKHPENEWIVCFVDLEGGKSAEDFVELILDAAIRSSECNCCLPSHLTSVQLWRANESEKLRFRRQERGRIKSNWKEYGHSFFEAMDSTDKRLLLILDECSFLLEDMITAGGKEAAVDLLQWFYDERRKAKNISFVLSGSEHLPAFLTYNDIEGPFLDDLEHMHLRLFDPLTAKDFIFLTFSGQGIVISLAEINQILSLMGEPIPYFLQLFIDSLCTECQGNDEISMQQIETIYYSKLLGAESKRYFESIEHQLERYKRYGSEARRGAEAILNSLALKDEVEIKELEAVWIDATGIKDGFSAILNILKDDFYVEVKDDSVCFLSKLIKDWWLRHGSALNNTF